MDKSLNQNTREIGIKSKRNRCGARVFGTPICRNLALFIEDVSPSAYQHRMLSMFFAGAFPMNISLNNPDYLEEPYYEEDCPEETPTPKAETKKSKGKEAKEK